MCRPKQILTEEQIIAKKMIIKEKRKQYYQQSKFKKQYNKCIDIIVNNNINLDNIRNSLSNWFPSLYKDEPIEEPITVTINEVIDEPIDEPVEEPVDVPVEEPIDEPIDEPVEEPVDVPVEEPVDVPVDVPVEPIIQEIICSEVNDIIVVNAEVLIDNIIENEPLTLQIQELQVEGEDEDYDIPDEEYERRQFENDLEYFLYRRIKFIKKCKEDDEKEKLQKEKLERLEKEILEKKEKLERLEKENIEKVTKISKSRLEQKRMEIIKKRRLEEEQRKLLLGHNKDVIQQIEDIKLSNNNLLNNYNKCKLDYDNYIDNHKENGITTLLNNLSSYIEKLSIVDYDKLQYFEIMLYHNSIKETQNTVKSYIERIYDKMKKKS